jgi:hypothetical protein
MADAPTYVIRNVWDFLAVPEKRIGACLREFKIALGMARGVEQMMNAISDELTPEPGLIRWKPGDEFRWVDDRKRTVTINITDGTNTLSELPHGSEGK